MRNHQVELSVLEVGGLGILLREMNRQATLPGQPVRIAQRRRRGIQRVNLCVGKLLAVSRRTGTAKTTQIEYPQVNQCCATGEDWASLEPITLANLDDIEYWDVKLEEVIQLSLAQSKMLRELGGAILRSPATVNVNNRG